MNEISQYIRVGSAPAIENGQGMIGKIQIITKSGATYGILAIIKNGNVIKAVNDMGEICRFDIDSGITVYVNNKTVVKDGVVVQKGGRKAGFMYASLDPEDPKRIVVGFSSWNSKLDKKQNLKRAKRVARNRAIRLKNEKRLPFACERLGKHGYKPIKPMPFAVRKNLPYFLDRAYKYFNKDTNNIKEFPDWCTEFADLMY